MMSNIPTTPACCSPAREKHRTEEERKALTDRLSRIEGQVRGLKGLIEKEAYCTDVITQSAAVTAALRSFERELLEQHIRTCVAEDIREGKDEVIDDLIATLARLMR